MGNVALMMRRIGHTVTGSDENMYPPMSDLLRLAGVTIATPFSPANLEPTPDLVVIGNRMSRGNDEVEAALNRRLPYTSLPELLKNHAIQGRRSIVMTGTHGKTTTSSMAAWVLESAGCAPSFLIGGVPGNFDAGWAWRDESDLIVLEGDEYDTAFFDKRSKFVHYLPTALVINNIEFDHADIFSSLDDILLSFRRLVNIVPSNGLIVANGDDENVATATSAAFTDVQTFGLGAGNNWRAAEIAYGAEETTFTLYVHGHERARVTLPTLGEFNVRNALGVIATASWLGLSMEAIVSGLSTFVNARRRLELKLDDAGVRIYDDFAHHPTAIRETLRALRHRHPHNRLWAIFEPRSNTTRRNVFQRELADAFGDADLALLAQIDRPEELPASERLDPDRLVEDLRARDVDALFLPDATTIAAHLLVHIRPGDVVVVMSNGGFGGIHRLLANGMVSLNS